MKITINQDVLKGIVENVSKASLDSKSLSILENILIHAENNTITMTGNNMTLAIKSTGEALVEENGTICFDSKVLNNFVKKLPTGHDVTFETDGTLLKLSCKGVKLHHAYVSAEAFPDFPVVTDATNYALPSDELKRCLKNALVATAKDGYHEVLKGSLIDILPEHINVVGIDGFRISIQKIVGSFGENRKAIVPSESVKEIIRLLPDTGDIPLMISNTHATFSIDNTTVLTRLIDGTYFDYSSFLTGEYATSTEVNRAELIESLERLSLFSDSDRGATKLNIVADSLTLNHNSNTNSISDTIALINKAGDDLLIGFNNRFLLDGMKSFNSDTIKINFSSPIRPAKIFDETDKSLYFVLPVKITA